MWDTYLCLLLNIKHLLFHVHINVWSNTAQQISRCWHSLKAPREANTWHSSSREPCRWPGLDQWEEPKTFCILSLVKSESPKIMERSVSLLPSAGGCKFHFVSALLSCDLVFAVHLPARQETREISEIIRPPPAQPIMRTITFEQEQERRKVMMDSLRQLWYVSTHCWRTFQLVWGETWWIVLSRHNFLLSWGNSIQISPEECLSRFMRDIQGEKFKAQNFSTSETPKTVVGQVRRPEVEGNSGF